MAAGPRWAGAAAVIVALGASVWASANAPPEERYEISARCAGVHLLIGLRLNSNFEGDDRRRRAAYLCFSGDLPVRHFALTSCNGRLVETRAKTVCWPLIFLGLVVAGDAQQAWSFTRTRRTD